MLRLFVVLSLALPLTLASAIQPDKKDLPIGLADFEKSLRLDSRPPLTAPPVGPVRSLGEWEEAEAIMTLWTNPSLIRAFVKRNKVKLFADGESEKNWWLQWLSNQGISAENISFFVVPTDSIWIRDYGPWPILDGQGKFGFTHGQYNRPRPQDDKIPDFLARTLNIPIYKHGLTHTGGNYYSDALGNAFSSTLVFSENSMLSPITIYERMKSFLGIVRYATSPLAPGETIEHLDTFGKLVSPDTWVWSEFPANSPYRADSEKMLALIRSLKSPYGTPYVIHRMKMRQTPGGDDYRAYINSFISNHTLYFPLYGDSIDEEAKTVYQNALPGYEIVGVDGLNTTWGDSVHCRNRNLLNRKTLFAFPKITQVKTARGVDVSIAVETIFPETPDPDLQGTLFWTLGNVPQTPVSLSKTKRGWLNTTLQGLAPEQSLSVYVELSNSAGKLLKRVPIGAPTQTIHFLTNI